MRATTKLGSFQGLALLQACCLGIADASITKGPVVSAVHDRLLIYYEGIGSWRTTAKG